MLKKKGGGNQNQNPWQGTCSPSHLFMSSFRSMWFILVIGTEFWEASLMPSTWSALSSRCNPSQVCFLHSFYGVCSFGIAPAVVELFYLSSVRYSEDTPSAFKRAM